ncbi:MAG: DinB family protein [Sediminibacterium sp.]|nr:DinB family protein [Sediminibacterium sp.]
MSKPTENSYPHFFKKYVDLVEANDFIEIQRTYFNYIVSFIDNLPAEKADFAYSIGKWTLKDLVQHLTDTDRVFTYRALRIARNDQTNLPSFDEKLFADNTFLKNRSFKSVTLEFKSQLIASLNLYLNLSEEQFNFSGFVNNNRITVNAIMFASYGHILHHIQIIKERYLP